MLRGQGVFVVEQRRFSKVMAAAVACTALTGAVLAAPSVATSAVPEPVDVTKAALSLTVTPNPTAVPLDRAQRTLVAKTRTALAQRPRVAHLTGGERLVVRDAIVEPNGTGFVRFVRLIGDVEVLGGDFVAKTSRSGRLLGVSQTLREPVAAPSAGPVGLGAALSAVIATTSDLLDLTPVSRRQVLLATGANPVTAWELTVAGRRLDGTPSRRVALVDTVTGRVLESQEHIETVEGRGRTLYSGKVDLDVARSGAGFVLSDPLRGNSRVLDAENEMEGALCGVTGGGCARGVPVTSSSTRFGNGAPSDRDTAAADIAYGVGVAWDYFARVQGRRGITGRGDAVESRVHYGRNYANAFWDGVRLTFGDGDGRTFGALVSLDVAAHELAHGVTQHTADLVYAGESGGLNESTSDIFGTLVEFYARNGSDPGDYFVGEEFDLSGGTGLRRMDRPSKDGISPDCYSAAVGRMDVHHSSGIGNHFFYTLAEGSGVKRINGVTHRSPSCDGTKVAGIGRLAAGKIWYRALTRYFTSRTTYPQARLATLAAAEDLYGARSSQRAAVNRAWSAAGVR